MRIPEDGVMTIKECADRIRWTKERTARLLAHQGLKFIRHGPRRVRLVFISEVRRVLPELFDTMRLMQDDNEHRRGRRVSLGAIPRNGK